MNQFHRLASWLIRRYCCARVYNSEGNNYVTKRLVSKHISFENSMHTYHYPPNRQFTRDHTRYREPDKFLPERFLGDNPEPDSYGSAFGFGRRYDWFYFSRSSLTHICIDTS